MSVCIYSVYTTKKVISLLRSSFLLFIPCFSLFLTGNICSVFSSPFFDIITFSFCSSSFVCIPSLSLSLMSFSLCLLPSFLYYVIRNVSLSHYSFFLLMFVSLLLSNFPRSTKKHYRYSVILTMIRDLHTSWGIVLYQLADLTSVFTFTHTFTQIF